MKFQAKRSTWITLGLVVLAMLPIAVALIAPNDSPSKKSVVGFVASPYYLALVFFLYLAWLGVMAWAGGAASRERRKANEALATIDLKYKAGDISAVIRDCHKQLATYPNDAALHWYLALATFAQRDFQVASPHFKRAAEIDARLEAEVKPFLAKIVSEGCESNHEQPLH